MYALLIEYLFSDSWLEELDSLLVGGMSKGTNPELSAFLFGFKEQLLISGAVVTSVRTSRSILGCFATISELFVHK